MANKKFLLGILAIVLVFGMMVMGCGEEPETPKEKKDEYGWIEIDNYYPIVGETITATYKTLQPDSYIGTLEWQWFRGKTSIGMNEATYTVESADVGRKITVKVSNNGKKCINDDSTIAVLNTPATATVAISMVAYRQYGSCRVNVTLTLSDGRWNRNTGTLFDICDLLVTLSGTPDISGWSRSMNGNLSRIGPSFTVEYTNLKELDSVPSINLRATLNSSKLEEIRRFTNVYNSLTVGTPSSVSVSEWDIR